MKKAKNFIKQFIEKLSNDEYKKELCPKPEFVMTDDMVEEELEKYNGVLYSGILDAVTIGENVGYPKNKKTVVGCSEYINNEYKQLYDVVVHTEEQSKKYEECELRNHGPYLFIEDVSEKYANDAENEIYFQCVCLECGKYSDFKMSRSDRRKVININTNSMEALLSFYHIREQYLKLKNQNLSSEEIVIKMNELYNSQEKAVERVLAKSQNKSN